VLENKYIKKKIRDMPIETGKTADLSPLKFCLYEYQTAQSFVFLGVNASNMNSITE
jgi:hypothetical protein